ncbi:hypothetical protein ANTRET_LOCUS5411 [Anthophora retusa]
MRSVSCAPVECVDGNCVDRYRWFLVYIGWFLCEYWDKTVSQVVAVMLSEVEGEGMIERIGGKGKVVLCFVRGLLVDSSTIPQSKPLTTPSTALLRRSTMFRDIMNILLLVAVIRHLQDPINLNKSTISNRKCDKKLIEKRSSIKFINFSQEITLQIDLSKLSHNYICNHCELY